MSLLGGLHGQRADQCDLLLAQAIENRPGGCVLQFAASFPADLLANPEPRVIVGRGRAAQHDVCHGASPLVEPHRIIKQTELELVRVASLPFQRYLCDLFGHCLEALAIPAVQSRRFGLLPELVLLLHLILLAA